MIRTTKPTTEIPSREDTHQGIIRTTRWLRAKFGEDEENFLTPANIKLKEPVWKGWVVAFPLRGAMFICCPHYLDTIFKLTPAGHLLLCNDAVIKQLKPHVKRLMKERRFGK